MENLRRLSNGLNSVIAAHKRLGVGTLIVFAAMLLGTGPGIANEPEPVTLQAAGNVQLQGRAEGSSSLTRMASRDRRRKLCLGYATPTPSHIVVLTEDRPRLRMAVNSSGEDTTLFIQGPGGIYCNDNASRTNRDAVVTARSWQAGTYRVWVGTFNQGDQLNYTLRVYEPGTARDRQ